MKVSRSKNNAQQSVHLTLGSLAKISGIFLALAFFQLDSFAVPAPAQVTQSVRRWGHLTIIEYLFYNLRGNHPYMWVVKWS